MQIHKLLEDANYDDSIGSNLVASWSNSAYETFTSSGADITSAIETGVDGSADSAAITIVSGAIYRIMATVTLNSGALPTFDMTNAGYAPTALTAGVNEIIVKATNVSTVLTLSNTAATDYSCTFTMHEAPLVTGTPVVIGPKRIHFTNLPIQVHGTFVGTCILEGTIATQAEIDSGTAAWSLVPDRTYTAPSMDILYGFAPFVRGRVSAWTSGVMNMTIMF